MHQNKKLCEQIQSKLYQYNPVLSTISNTKIIKEEIFNSFQLQMQHKERIVLLCLLDDLTTIKGVFKWNDAEILEALYFDLEKLSLLIVKWLVDLENSSQLLLDFPEIKLSELAIYYENGNGVEGEFIVSWKQIESFVKNNFGVNQQELLQLIQKIKEKGFDKMLRAGTILETIVLSRSVRYGLREDQKSVSFYFLPSKMIVKNKYEQIFEFDTITYNDTIENILKELVEELIN